MKIISPPMYLIPAYLFFLMGYVLTGKNIPLLKTFIKFSLKLKLKSSSSSLYLVRHHMSRTAETSQSLNQAISHVLLLLFLYLLLQYAIRFCLEGHLVPPEQSPVSPCE